MSEAGKNVSATTPESFEDKLEHIDRIVKELEARDVPIDRAATLFKEGKALVRDCDAMLKKVQEQIEKAMSDTPS